MKGQMQNYRRLPIIFETLETIYIQDPDLKSGVWVLPNWLINILNKPENKNV